VDGKTTSSVEDAVYQQDEDGGLAVTGRAGRDDVNRATFDNNRTMNAAHTRRNSSCTRACVRMGVNYSATYGTAPRHPDHTELPRCADTRRPPPPTIRMRAP